MSVRLMVWCKRWPSLLSLTGLGLMLLLWDAAYLSGGSRYVTAMDGSSVGELCE